MLLVVVVLVVLINSAQTPCPEAAAYTFFESIIKSLIGYAVLLISTIQTVADLGQLLVLAAILRHKINGYAVIAILIDNTDHAEVNLIDLEAWLVLELVA